MEFLVVVTPPSIYQNSPVKMIVTVEAVIKVTWPVVDYLIFKLII